MKNNVTSVAEWIQFNSSEEDYKELFFNMGMTMKFLHNKGYCIKTFNLGDIEILNDSVKLIRYKTLLKMPDDVSFQDELKHEDVYNSSFMQVSLYTNCNNLNPVFLAENFDSFSTFLPEDDVGYYRGILKNGNNIYYSDYVFEKKKRQTLELNKQVNSDGGRGYTKSNSNLSIDDAVEKEFDKEKIIKENSKLNKLIYSVLFKLNSEAFGTYVIYPLILGVCIAITFVLINIYTRV